MTAQPPRNPFESNRKLTRAERKAIERAAARRREWEAAQQADAAARARTLPLAPAPVPALPAPTPAAAPPPYHQVAAAGTPVPVPQLPARTRTRSGGWHALSVLVAAVLTCAAIGVGAPVLAHPLRPVPLVGFLLAAGITLYLTRDLRTLLRVRTRIVVYLLYALLVAAFTVGAATSVVVDGTVYAVTSPTAKAHRVSVMMRDDLRRMAELDALLSYDQATSRANYNKYDPAQEELTALSAKYSRVENDDVPSAQFLVLAEKIKTAAYFQALAMEGKRKLVLVEDAKLAADTNSYRTTFVETVLEISPQLRDLAAQYGISLAASQDGPVE